MITCTILTIVVLKLLYNDENECINVTLLVGLLKSLMQGHMTCSRSLDPMDQVHGITCHNEQMHDIWQHKND